MKSDIMVEYSKLNNSQRRFLCGLWNGVIEKRMKELKRNG
jgi:hypothetical protein